MHIDDVVSGSSTQTQSKIGSDKPSSSTSSTDISQIHLTTYNSELNPNISNSSVPDGYRLRPLRDRLYFFVGDALLGGIISGLASYCAFSNKSSTSSSLLPLEISTAVGLVVTAALYRKMRKSILYERTQPDLNLITRQSILEMLDANSSQLSEKDSNRLR